MAYIRVSYTMRQMNDFPNRNSNGNANTQFSSLNQEIAFYFQVFRDSGFHSGAKCDQERGGVHYYLQKLCPCRARGWDITLNSLEKQVAECRITNYWHEHEI